MPGPPAPGSLTSHHACATPARRRYAAGMGTDPGQHADDFRLFQTTEHACGYWPERVARDLVFDPRDPRMQQWYPLALGWGFRRSGDIVYRPHCAQCRACVAVRIPVARFHPDRSQRRCLARNANVDMRVRPAERTDEQLALYRRYLTARHAGGGMDGHGALEFDQFLVGSWSEGRFIELREHADNGQGQLLAVAVTDVVDSAISAVYTFYEPGLEHRSLGTLSILKQIEWARSTGRTHLYLGYWIHGHRKMDYKRRFRPIEGFDGREWRDLDFATR
jgi:arginine-tRNA-protein transferase